MSNKASNSASTDRRNFLKRFIGGACAAASFLIIPISGISRLVASSAFPKIPIKPFRKSDLDKPCKWAG